MRRGVGQRVAQLAGALGVQGQQRLAAFDRLLQAHAQLQPGGRRQRRPRELRQARQAAIVDGGDPSRLRGIDVAAEGREARLAKASESPDSAVEMNSLLTTLSVAMMRRAPCVSCTRDRAWKPSARHTAQSARMNTTGSL